MASADILGAFASKFLRDYWQQRPLLIRQAFPGGIAALDADELAGLACSEGVESRLILEQGAVPWETRHGPFSESDFQKLPASHWTLLVQAVDRLVPTVSALRQKFRFIPNWRIDDIMISYAPDQGSVGPHIDQYDVFLIQGQGRRRWEISAGPLADPELVEGLDLKILRHFHPDHSFELEAGDMLYLPPGVAHHGVALGESLTYSVGFRAPHHKEMLSSYLHFLLQQLQDEPESFYRDQEINPAREPGLITSTELEDLWLIMQKGWQRPELFKRWVGGFVTEPRSFQDEAEAEFDLEEFTQGRQGQWQKLEGGRSAFHLAPEGILYFYVEGECLELDPSLEPMAAYLSREECFDTQQLLTWQSLPGFADFLQHLWHIGFLRKDE